MTPLALLCVAATILGSTGLEFQDSKDFKDYETVPGVGRYLFVGAPKNWTEAVDYCSTDQGQLAMIDSDAERNVLRTIMAKNGATSVHMGFHDRFTEGEYITITNEEIGRDQWAAQYPYGSSQLNCGRFNASKGLMDSECKATLPFVCEYGIRGSMGDYERLPGHGFYKYHVDKGRTTWPEAWEICRSEGAYLHVLNSVAERDALYDRYKYTFVWVGVHRANAVRNDQLVTVNNEPLNSIGFSQWYAANPYGTFLSNPYVANSHREGMYTLTSADTTPFFICEIDP